MQNLKLMYRHMRYANNKIFSNLKNPYIKTELLYCSKKIVLMWFMYIYPLLIFFGIYTTKVLIYRFCLYSYHYWIADYCFLLYNSMLGLSL